MNVKGYLENRLKYLGIEEGGTCRLYKEILFSLINWDFQEL